MLLSNRRRNPRFSGLIVALFLQTIIPLLAAPARADVLFQPVTSLPVPASPGLVRIGDFNQDGKPDIATANLANDGMISILLNSGEGHFAPAANYPSIAGISSWAEGDFNGDGAKDLILSGGVGGIAEQMGNGDGSFQDPKAIKNDFRGCYCYVSSVAAGDFNRDGRDDFAYIVSFGNSQKSDTLYVSLGNGDGSFREFASFWVGYGASRVVAGDMNNDDKTDLILLNTMTARLPDLLLGRVRVMLGKGDGTFAQADFSIGQDGPWDLALGDFNRDGKTDVVVVSQQHRGYSDQTFAVTILRGNGDGTLGDRLQYQLSAPACAVATGDFNDDGNLDVATVNSGGYAIDPPDYSSVSVLLNDGTGGLLPQQGFSAGKGPYGIASGDLNGDGKDDLVATDLLGTKLSLFLNANGTVMSSTLSRSLAKAGDEVEIETVSNHDLSGPPTVHVTGPCVEPSTFLAPATDQPRVYQAEYTVPDGGIDCAVSFTFSATDDQGDPASGNTLSLTADRTAPASQVFVGGILASNGWYTSPAALTLASSDATSGVQTTYYSLDDASCGPDSLASCQIYTAALMVEGEEAHNLTFFSRDMAGNVEIIQSQGFKINRTAPVAADQAAALEEDSSLEMTLSATDNVGDPLTYTVINGPAHGVLGPVTGNTVTYTPDRNYHGNDSFTFKANDGNFDSNLATVSLTVQSVNDTPVAEDQSATGYRDRSLSLHLNVSDADGDALTYEIVAQPEHGTLSGSLPNLTYTPVAGYTGPDQFTFRASDGTANSRIATVSISTLLPLLTVGTANALPDEMVTLSLSITEAISKIAALDLTLSVNAPDGTPALAPTFSLGDQTGDWQLLTDPQDPWHISLVSANGIAGPAELLKLSVHVNPATASGTVYALEVQSASYADENGQNHVIDPALTAPGSLEVGACIEAVPGDVNHDGTVSLGDAILALRMAVGIASPPNACVKASADIDCNGVIQLGDVVAILRKGILGIDLLACS